MFLLSSLHNFKLILNAGVLLVTVPRLFGGVALYRRWCAGAPGAAPATSEAAR